MKCSPKIWKKLSSRQQLLWSRMNKAFSDPFNFPPEWMKDKKKIEVVAHNLALQVVWDGHLEIVE